jgi:glycosyltransferase involved in cell wall biosynthesis
MEKKSPRICLNMIVKNEEKIICRLLKSVLPLIDTYCICDTGSTDNTIQVIHDYCKQNGIMDGVIEEHAFRDFGYSRNKALDMCKKRDDVDYILLVDADMKLEIEIKEVSLWKSQLNCDAYYILQGNDGFYYKNVRLIKNRNEFSYWGVTHEYMQCPDDTQYGNIQKNMFFIHDIGDGGSKENKFMRDITLLKKGLEEHPNNDRYTFYLANSYLDVGQYQGAIDTYMKRIEIGGWKEEVWCCYYSIGKAYEALGKIEHAIHYWMEGYQYYPERIENLYRIVKYYRILGKNKIAHWYYKMAQYSRDHYNHSDHLFFEKDVYEYKLDYEWCIISYYFNPLKETTSKSFLQVWNTHYVDDGTKQNCLENYKFYSKKLCSNSKEDEWISLWKTAVDTVRDSLEPSFNTSTPSVVLFGDHMGLLIRCVNYYIDENGNYHNQQHIISINKWFVWNKKTKELIHESQFEGLSDEGNLYVGLEDVRLLYNGSGDLVYSGNKGLEYQNIKVEMGTIHENGTHKSGEIIMKEDNAMEVEKNWVSYVDTKGSVRTIYKFEQLQEGVVSNGKFFTERTQETPWLFKKLRGSTHGIWIKNRIWFLTHMVSYESKRHYYHCWVVLDANGKLYKYSEPFSFEGKHIEYSNGFVYDEATKKIYIGYSIMDNETKFIMIPYDELESQFTFNVLHKP